MELIYIHKSMGKVLVPSAMSAGLRLASSCKVIPSLSEPVWPHSTSLGSKAAVADRGLEGRGVDGLCDPCEYSYNALL